MKETAVFILTGSVIIHCSGMNAMLKAHEQTHILGAEPAYLEMNNQASEKTGIGWKEQFVVINFANKHFSQSSMLNSSMQCSFL